MPGEESDLLEMEQLGVKAPLGFGPPSTDLLSKSSSSLAVTPYTKRRGDALDPTSRSAASDLSVKKQKIKPPPIQTAGLKNDSEFSLGEYSPNASPNKVSSIVKPSYDAHQKRIRRFSEDLSATLDTITARSKQTVITSNNLVFYKGTKKQAAARGTTSGVGRSMSMTGPKALGSTRYAEFLSKLAATTGLAAGDLALALRNGLLKGAAFEETVDSLKTEKQKAALIQTVLLLHNEIINRSAGNLIAIIGAIDRQIKYPENVSGKTLIDRLNASALFVPKGGQALSSFARKDTAEADVPANLKGILDNNAMSLQRAMQGLGDDAQAQAHLLSLSKQYADNLTKYWTFEIREPKPKPGPPRKLTGSAGRQQQNKKANTFGKLRAFL